MSIFSCNITYTKIKGDSEKSTYNNLVAHGFIDESYKILNDDFYKANRELNLLASNKLGKDVNLYQINNKEAVPNTEVFKEIDDVNNLKKWKEIKFNTDIEKYNMLEWVVNGERNIISSDMLTKEQYAKQFAQTELKNEILSTSTPVLSTSKDKSFKFSLLPKQTTEFSWRNSINSRGQFELGDTLYKRINKRNINEVWSSGEFTNSERKQLLLSFIQQKLSDRDSFNGKLINKINSKLGKLDFNLVDDRMFYALGNSININLDAFYDEINKTDKQNLSYYLDLVISEELIHVVTSSLINKQDIVNILQEQGLNKFLTAVDTKYENLPNSSQAYETGVYEYIRMIVQNEFLGTTTEQVKYENKPYFLQKILQVWDFLKSIAGLPKTKEVIQKHIDFIKDKIETKGSNKFNEVYNIQLTNPVYETKSPANTKLSETIGKLQSYDTNHIRKGITKVDSFELEKVVALLKGKEVQTKALQFLNKQTRDSYTYNSEFVNETYKEIWDKKDGRELNTLLPLFYHLSEISSDPNKVFKRIEQNLYKEGYIGNGRIEPSFLSLDFNSNKDYPASSTSKMITFNLNTFYKNFASKLPFAESYLYADRLLLEEYIHLVANNIVTQEEIDIIYKELSQKEKNKVKLLYKNVVTKEDLVHEYLRMVVQQKESGEITEFGKNLLYKIFERAINFLMKSFDNKPIDSQTKKTVEDIIRFTKQLKRESDIQEENLPVDSSNYNFNVPCITNKK